MAARAKVLEYGVSLDRELTARSDRGGPSLAREESWSPEHLLLAALARCTMTSLAYHARRGGIAVQVSADASGRVTKRDSDERYAFVDIEVAIDAELEPAPADPRELIAQAERDCFVGASLTATPRYSWTVGGQEIR